MGKMDAEGMLEAYCLISSKLSGGAGPRTMKVKAPWERPGASPQEVCLEAMGALRGRPLDEAERKAAMGIISREGGTGAFMDRMRQTLEAGMDEAFAAEAAANPRRFGRSGYSKRVEDTMRAADRGTAGPGTNPPFGLSELSGFIEETSRAGLDGRA